MIRRIVTIAALVTFITFAAIGVVTAWFPAQIVANGTVRQVFMLDARDGVLQVAWQSPAERPVSWGADVGDSAFPLLIPSPFT